MDYELIKIDKLKHSLLVKADGVELWVDYYCTKEGSENFYNWEFNQYIYCLDNSKDIEIKETQEKIYKDIENFNYFMDEIFYNYLEN